MLSISSTCSASDVPTGQAVHTGCLSAAPQRFITVQTAFALSPASKNRSASIVFRLRAPAKPPSPETILPTDRGNPNLPRKEFERAKTILEMPISRLAGLCHANSLARQSVCGENDPRNVRGILTRIWAPHTRCCMCWFRIGAIPIITIIAQSIVPAFSPAPYLCTGGHVVLLPEHRHTQSANNVGEISLALRSPKGLASGGHGFSGAARTPRLRGFNP